MALTKERQGELLKKLFEDTDLTFEDASDIVENKSTFKSLSKNDLQNDSFWSAYLNLLTLGGSYIYNAAFNNSYDVFLEKYSSQVAKSVESGGITLAEMELFLNNRADFIQDNLFTEDEDYVEKIVKAIIKNPNSIPSELSAIIRSGNQFDVESAKKVRETLDSGGVRLDDLHHVQIADQTKYMLRESTSNLAQATGGRIPKASFDTIAETEPEIAELRASSINFTSDLGGGSTLNTTNVSSIDNDLFVESYMVYLYGVLRRGSNPLTTFNDDTDKLAEKISKRSFKEFENNRRIELWNRLVAANSEGGDGITAEEAANALNGANAAAIEEASNSGIAGRIEDSSPLSEAEIEQRQRFYQQCVLLVQMNNLKSYYSDDINSDDTSTWHDNSVYNDRFYMITDGEDNSTFVNTLTAPKGDTIKDFLNITPDIQAFLVPKIRLFKVFGTGDNLRQVEFVFRNNSYNNNYMSNLFSDNSIVTRGSGYGIKEISFSFEGASPATAKNDIKFGIKLFFQDFKDFVTPFDTVDSKGKAAKARFVDLILFDQKDNPQVTNNQLRQQYDPQYYRIRADVGWQVPNENDQQFISVCNKRGLSASAIKNAIVKMNKSFYLTMVEHDLDFDKTGTVTVTGEYRAYIESQLKTTRFDALSDPAIIASRKVREERLAKAKKQCTPGEIAQLKSIYNGQEKAEVRTVQKRIINKLYEKNKIFNVVVKDDGDFRETGAFTKMPSISEAAKTYNTEEQENSIQFFYLGDLFYIILDSMYGESGDPKIDKTKFILPSIELEAYLSGETGYTINVAQIPISINYFKEWYTQTIVKPERKSYAIMYFIRDLLNNLIVDALIDTCLNRDYNKSFRFNSTTVTTNGDVLTGKTTKNDYIINIADPANGDLFPLTAETETGEPADIADLVTYVFIIPVYNTITNKGLGNYFDDVDRGVYHFEIGTDRGILNEVKFSKIDMEYIREARFEQSRGVDDLLQLAAVYKASLKLFGNTLFYPGMTLFINPFGLGGNEFIPSDPNSIANKLGLGGYHLVTRVNSIISNGSFKTDVEAMFVYPGDGVTRALVQGNNQPKDGAEDDITTAPPDPDPNFCDTLIREESDYLKNLAREAEIQESEDITAPSPSESPPSSPAAGRVVEALKEAGGANDANETAVVIDGQTFSYQSFVVNDDKTLVTYYNSEGDAVFAQELENGEPTGNYLY
jgi:hypothetical protein